MTLASSPFPFGRTSAIRRADTGLWVVRRLVHGLLSSGVIVAVVLTLATPTHAADAADKERGSRRKRSSEADLTTPATAPTTFAPLPADHELASIWNDPDFTRRLIGSYGFLSDREPRLTPEEQAAYRDKVVPLLREDPKKAVPELEALAKPGASAVFDYTLGTIHFQNEDLTNAVTRFEAALAKFPDYLRAQKNLGLALVRAGRYADAIKPLSRTLQLGGADGRVYGLLAFSLLSQNRYVSADGAYRQALVLEPDNADFKLGLVKCAIATRNYDHASALLDEMIQAAPEKESLWTLQANVLIQQGKSAQAVQSLEVLRRLGKATPANLYTLGDLYLALEVPEQALAAYTQAIEQDAGQNPARAIRPAQILVSRGAYNEARKLFEKIRSAGGTALPTDEELKLLKLEARAAMALNEGEAAIRSLETLIERNPLDAEALLLAGDYYAKNSQEERAQFRYDAASKVEGYEADGFLKLAQLNVAAQRYPVAVELLRKAQKAKPRDNVQRYLEKVEQLALRAR